MKRKLILAAAAVLASAGAARAEVKTEVVEYQQGETVLQGFFAWDDAVKGKRPGVLVIHEWWGHNQHARNQAVRLAKAGFVGFALDMYGKGKLAKHPEDAQAFVKEATADPAVPKARFEAAVARLKAHRLVDGAHLGAVGYCFGGGVALSMARAGEDLDAVATFHGALANRGPPAEKGKVKPRILVLTGGADTFVPKEQVEAFEQEMKDAGARVEVISYPGVKHSFTNPDAAQAGMAALAYDADADRKSWKAAMKMFHEVWKTGRGAE
jgi:dienelactone hydrolase